MFKKSVCYFKINLFLSTIILSPLEAVYAMDNPQSYKEQEGLVRQEEQPLKKLISIDSMKDILTRKPTKINPNQKRGASFGNRCALELCRWIENQTEHPKQLFPRDKEEDNDFFFEAFSKKEGETKFEPKAIRLEYGSAKPVELTFDVVTFVKKAGYQTLEDYLTKIPLKSIPTASGKFRVGFLYLFDTNPKDKGYLINFYCTENSLNKYFIIDPQWGTFKTLSTFLSRETGKYMKYLYIGYVKDESQTIAEPSKTPKRPRNEKEEFSKIKLKRKKLAISDETTVIKETEFEAVTAEIIHEPMIMQEPEFIIPEIVSEGPMVMNEPEIVIPEIVSEEPMVRNEPEAAIPEIVSEPMVVNEPEVIIPEIVNQLEILSHPEGEMFGKTIGVEILDEPEGVLTAAEVIYEAEILNESDFTVAKVVQSKAFPKSRTAGNIKRARMQKKVQTQSSKGPSQPSKGSSQSKKTGIDGSAIFKLVFEDAEEKHEKSEILAALICLGCDWIEGPIREMALRAETSLIANLTLSQITEITNSEDAKNIILSMAAFAPFPNINRIASLSISKAAVFGGAQWAKEVILTLAKTDDLEANARALQLSFMALAYYDLLGKEETVKNHKWKSDSSLWIGYIIWNLANNDSINVRDTAAKLLSHAITREFSWANDQVLKMGESGFDNIISTAVNTLSYSIEQKCSWARGQISKMPSDAIPYLKGISEQVFNSHPIQTVRTMPTMQRDVRQNGAMAPQVMANATFPLTLPMRVLTPPPHPVMMQTLATSQLSGTALLLQADTHLTGISQEPPQNLQSVVPQVEISTQASQNSEGGVAPSLVEMSEYEQREQTIRELEQQLATLRAQNAKTN